MFEGMKGKLGPLPVWAWGLIIGGIVVGVYYWRQVKDDNGQEITSDNESAALAEQEGDSGYVASSDLVDSAFTPGSASGSSLATVDTATPSDTNDAWAARVIAKLTGAGVAFTDAQAAVSKLLNGEELSADESALVDRGQKLEGTLPPEALSTVTKNGSSNAAVSKWMRSSDGSIQAVLSNGSKVNKSLSDYIDAGLPGFSYNAYEFGTHRAKSSSTTVADIAKFHGTTVENLVVINGWKTIPNLKKGSRVKVPARKKVA